MVTYIVAKWLVHISNNRCTSCDNTITHKIDINANDDYAFRWACVNGHLEIAKLLYSICNKPTNMIKNRIFKWVCGHVEVADWIVSIYPCYVSYSDYKLLEHKTEKN